MQYLMFAVCLLLLLYTCYLVTRCRMPRIPEQIGQYGPGLGLGIGVLLVNSLLLTFAVWTALEKAVIPWAVFTLLPVVYCCLVSRNLYVVAFSEALVVVRGLFGPPVAYRWEDVSAYTVRREKTRGRFSHIYDMYRLTLPDRVLAISNAEDAGRALLQVFERRRPELKVVRQAKQGNDKNKAVC